ncbi:neuraminidase-like domain-containing protein [Bradyrhizobium sp. AZCC 1699]|uniref:Tc toxin subunit A-related protein n=1 Tax=Bradyrhizobium sp. AZCC 1699 TaxID=3117024 RepID=UPI002FF026EC
MADFIVLRLTPAAPIAAATFANYLTGLTINVFDASFATPKAGMPGDATPPIGSATFNAPAFVGLPAPLPPPPIVNYPAGTTIVQHFIADIAGPFVTGVDMQSVATAVIPYAAPAAEYPNPNPRPDLRIQFQRAGGLTMVGPDVYYDASLYTAGGAPAPDEYQSLADSDVSAFVTLPAALNSSLADVDLPADGSLPSYDSLLNAINTVLAADPGAGADLATLTATQPLTPNQCRNIAYEIVWGTAPHLPAPSGDIERMYTNPPNDGGLTNTNEQDRMQFEGQLNSYYATRNAKVERLAKYVYALGAAVWCEQQTQAATRAFLRFPVNPPATPTLATVNDAEIILTGALGLDIPAQYFYVLGAQLPLQVTLSQRFSMACSANQQQNLTQLTGAVDDGVIVVPPTAPQPAVNPAQAVRLLSTLAVPAASTAPECPVASAAAVWNDFMAYPATSPPPDNWRSWEPGDDEIDFWPAEFAKGAAATAYLALDLCALTAGYIIAKSAPPVSLADHIAVHLVVAVVSSPPTSVQELAKALPSDWKTLFKNSPPPLDATQIDLLPSFTLPGTPDERIAAFIRHVRKFFDLPNPAASATAPPAAAAPTLQLPTAVDPIQSFVVAYGALIGGAFTFGTTLVDAHVDAAVATVFPADPAAQAWLKNAIHTLNDLCALAGVPGAVNPLAASPEFSFAESLYARGFTSVAHVLALSPAEFQDALRGTVAYDQAAAIYAKAQTLGSPSAPPSVPQGPFQPVNPGTLTNCVPPCYLSPLGPVEYLHELLQLSEASTCEHPFAPPAQGHLTLGTAVADRRGPIGSLHATRGNLDTPLPLIDLVNECLEYMTAAPATHGTVYDTSEKELHGHKLCEDECCHPEEEKGIGLRHTHDEPVSAEHHHHEKFHHHKHDEPPCHDRPTLFEAVPEYSTPAPPSTANAAVEPAAFNLLKHDFSSCCLPYSQAIDVARVYLRHFCTTRYETMRTFRRCITEFVLDPENEPSGFQPHLWRNPVRIDIAIEYLCITPEEYAQVFGGAWPEPCGDRSGSQSPAGVPTQPQPHSSGAGPSPRELYGFASIATETRAWTDVGVRLPEFLRRTCLSYCEFFELWKSGFVKFRNGDDKRYGEFPECEPCCLEDLWIDFPDVIRAEQGLYELAIFIRLWRKLRGACEPGYTFVELADICSVLELYKNNAINPDFIRQLAAFKMLRDEFALRLIDPRTILAPGATGADRTHILALWVGPGAAMWSWAVNQLLDRVQHYACTRCHGRYRPELLKLLRDNLDPLSKLAGFNPALASDTWHALPTHTLRLAEVLLKIYLSNFGVGEIIFLFTADPHVDGDDPFPLQEHNEALDSPLEIPDDNPEYTLWKLRHTLLAAQVSDEEASEWPWTRVARVLHWQFGYSEADVTALGEHFFPHSVAGDGPPVPLNHRRYAVALAAASTAPLMWNMPRRGPFNYDAPTQTLWMVLPLTDAEVLEQFRNLRSLTLPERQAVQDLYFSPRRTLAAFAFIFANFEEAERRLIESREPDRWSYFQHQFALFYKRCELIAEHLTAHVAAATRQPRPDNTREAMLLLHELFADENRATASWENDNGHVPPVTWTPPNGGAFAALLGLTGTGLLGEYTPDGGTLVWRDVSGAMTVFGHERNRRNCPVPGVVPALDLTLAIDQLQFVTVLNGLAMRNTDDVWLGGAQGFSVKWTGALLVDREGTYEFSAGGPTPEGEKPDPSICDHQQWRVMLKRGQRTWTLLQHQWHEQHAEPSSSVHLLPGVYELTIWLNQHGPAFHSDDEAIPQHTGFQIKYAGPDTEDKLIALPHDRLFRVLKDNTLGEGIAGLSTVTTAFLNEHYTSTLRDIRRTYERAFKALLFVHRFALSAKRSPERRSELGYMLTQKEKFAGRAYYRSGGNFLMHAADFDFDLLPLRDDYHEPSAAQDARVQPSLQRTQALFDWWERAFDYTRMRDDVARRTKRDVWMLFDEANEKQPAHPAYLLRHMGIDARHWQLDVHYFQAQGTPVYSLTSDDMEDDRWVVRAWHADEWIRRLLHYFCGKDIRKARPDLWASDDPSAVVPGVWIDGDPNPPGNTNLFHYLLNGCIESGEPRRYADVQRLNDCLRERGRDALLAYLCAPNRVALPWGGFAETPNDLSSLLLVDVEAGVCERASRIEEAITAVQSFVRRARLGLEPGWTVSYGFAHLWDRRFKSYKVWEACKCRELYKENWIDWDQLKEAQKVESFRFLESELRRATVTVAAPGGLEYWPDPKLPRDCALTQLQDRDPSLLLQITPPREGLGLLGTPERDARPSWLAPPSGMQAPPADIRGIAERAIAAVATPSNPASAAGPLPFWIEAAIRLGVRFYRIAVGGVPPASVHFEPHGRHATAGCCAECGSVHPAMLDEYYFWLLDARFFQAVNDTDSPSFTIFEQDDYYDPFTQQSTLWHDPEQEPCLLEWRSSPIVRLAWCRVHNGEFKQPRRSYAGVQIVPGGATPDLMFLGRVADSLIFQVSTGVVPTGYNGTDAPGFRYDLAADTAVVLPLVEDPTPTASTFPGGLPAYPYFTYVDPGASLLPKTLYSPALAIACALRTRCRFESALKWYAHVFNPLERDDTWIHCPPRTGIPEGGSEPTGEPTGVVVLVSDDSAAAPGAATVAGGPASVPPHGSTPDTHHPSVVVRDSACCDSTDVSDAVALNRSILLHYLETMLQWGDALMRCHSPEEFQQARVIYDTMAMILGPPPHAVIATPPATPQTVSSFTPLFAPLNPRLLALYTHTQERLGLIRHRLNAYRLRNGRPNVDIPYWGEDACCGCETPEFCTDGCHWPCPDECCHLPSPYRFVFLLQKAQELATHVREFGAALLAAFEKGDAEYLASLRAGHERELLNLALSIRKDQWRDADWQWQALLKTKEVAQTNRRYYATLIQNSLNSGELQYEALNVVSLSTHALANDRERVAEAMHLIPDLFVGFPCNETWLALGTKLAGMFQTVARITHSRADMAAQTGGVNLTQAGWARRLEEWIHQVEVLDIEIHGLERQILGSERRRNIALQELNNHQRQIEQSKEVLDFLRDKFTNHELYLFLQKEMAALHYRMYELALLAARQAERAFNFERGYTKRTFIPCESWDTLHEGLLAGDRLQLALRTMEKAYLDANVREYELNKHISLRLHFPLQFLQLKTTGACEIQIPEWLFDLDYPGQFMRRIKNVMLTIPTVTGPYTGVHCRLTLLSSQVRVDPSLSCPPAACCGKCECENEYETCHCDPRIVRQYGAREAIATSSGQNDSGLFELSFRDERYLPFEFLGAVSRWRIELPRNNNFFDMDTLSDVVFSLNYTAREGGDVLSAAANEAAQCHVRHGWSLFDVRSEFPDAWHVFQSGTRRDLERDRLLTLSLTRRLFPFLPCDRALMVVRFGILFETREAREYACCQGEYTCCGTPRADARPCRCGCEPHLRHCDAYSCTDCQANCCCECIPNCHVIEFTPRTRHHTHPGECHCDNIDVRCVASDAWPGLYYGVVDYTVGPLHDDHRREVTLEFPPTVGEVLRLYVLCYFEAVPAVCDPPARRHHPFVKPAAPHAAAADAGGNHP